jgi:2-isopropylmalate synthase
MLRNPVTYEYLEPARFGRRRSMLVGRHSGRAVLRYLLDQIDVPATESLVSELYEEHIASRTDRDCDEMDVLADRLSKRFRS